MSSSIGCCCRPESLGAGSFVAAYMTGAWPAQTIKSTSSGRLNENLVISDPHRRTPSDSPVRLDHAHIVIALMTFVYLHIREFEFGIVAGRLGRVDHLV